MARAHAIATNTSISKAVGDLLRRRLAPTPVASAFESSDDATSYFDPVLGVRVSRGNGRALDEEQIRRALEDEDAYAVQLMGAEGGETQRRAKS